MSRQTNSLPILEISPGSIVAYDPSTDSTYRASDIAGVASHISGKDVIVAFSRRSTFVRAVRMPDAPRFEIGQILSLQIAGFFPVAAGELAYDFRLTSDKNQEGRLVIVGAVRGAFLKSTLDEATAAGLRVRAFVPAAFGSWALSQKLGQPTCAVVEATTEGLAIDVIEEGELRYSRVAPMPRNPAEFEAELSRTFSVSGVSSAPPVITAGETVLPAQQSTEDPTLKLLTAPIVDSLGINIEPAEAQMLRERARITSRKRLTAALALVAVGLLVVGYLDHDRAAAAAKEQTRGFNARVGRLRTAEKTAKAEATKEKAIAERLTQAFQPAQRMSDILKIASGSVPPDTWLTGITAERGKPVSFRGISKSNQSIAAYLDILSANDRFREVSLAGTTNSQIDEVPVVMFSVGAHAVGNLPLREDARTARK